jgi:starch synthase (maltosyl-transferring)
VLAATLSPLWGIYSGFELFENAVLAQGREEYLDSEKFQYRPRDWKAAEESGENLNMLLGRLNQIRREHPALQQLRDLHFHHTPHSSALVYSKKGEDDVVIVVCSLDPHNIVETEIYLGHGGARTDGAGRLPRARRADRTDVALGTESLCQAYS